MTDLSGPAPASETYRPSGVSVHYVCVKGNSHWLSHSTDWGPHPQAYQDGCRVTIHVEGGHVVHLTVLPDEPT